jgi:hypothetical protein
MGYTIGVIGIVIFMDALYSLMLYIGGKSYRGDLQTWGKDHWVRAVRGVCGIALVVMGWFI